MIGTDGQKLQEVLDFLLRLQKDVKGRRGAYIHSMLSEWGPETVQGYVDLVHDLYRRTPEGRKDQVKRILEQGGRLFGKAVYLMDVGRVLELRESILIEGQGQEEEAVRTNKRFIWEMVRDGDLQIIRTEPLRQVAQNRMLCQVWFGLPVPVPEDA